MGSCIFEGGGEDLLGGDGVAEVVAVVVEFDGDGGGGDAVVVVFCWEGTAERDRLGSLRELCGGSVDSL